MQFKYTGIQETRSQSPVQRPFIHRFLPAALIALVMFAATNGYAQDNSIAEPKVRVATRHTPPFAIKGDDGQWTGISIDLWRTISAELGLKTEFVDMDLKTMLASVEEGNVDVVAAALTVTAEREEVMDFSHPFHSSGLGLAVVSEPESGFGALVQIFSPAVLKILGVIFLAMLSLGVLVYFLERRKNPENFERGLGRGLLSGIWWAAVTMTTVGYGDKVPRTLPGRLIAMVWMFTGIILIAIFTGVVSSALTVSKLKSSIGDVDDLPTARVACVANSTSSEFLHVRHIKCKGYPTALAAMNAVAAREQDVVVYDAPILRYLAHKHFPGTVHVLPETVQRQDYAFAFPSGSVLREPCNRVMLRLIHEQKWQHRLKKYLGE